MHAIIPNMMAYQQGRAEEGVQMLLFHALQYAIFRQKNSKKIFREGGLIFFQFLTPLIRQTSEWRIAYEYTL